MYIPYDEFDYRDYTQRIKSKLNLSAKRLAHRLGVSIGTVNGALYHKHNMLSLKIYLSIVRAMGYELRIVKKRNLDKKKPLTIPLPKC